MEKIKQRIAYLDNARGLAIILVVLCHCVEEGLYRPIYSGPQFIPISSQLWIFENTALTIGRVGVPLFLMVTGALMLGRETQVIPFYKKRVLPLLCLYEIWVVVGYLFLVWFQGPPFDIKFLIGQMCFIASPLMAQMWYMPMIIGIYLAIPFINMMIRNLPDRRLLFIPMAAIVITCVISKLSNIIMIYGGNPINMQIDTSFSGFFFGFYLFAGYLIAHAPEELTVRQHKQATMLALTCIIVGLLANTLGQLFFYRHTFFRANFLWYDSPFVMMMSLGVFWLIRCHTKRETALKPIASLARFSFPIFFIHYFILLILRRLIPGLPGWSTPFQVVTLLVLTLIISGGLSWLLTRNETVGHTLFNFKDRPTNDKLARAT